MRVFAERSLSDINLGFPEQVILMYLTNKDCASQEQIARYFEIDKGAIAKSIGKLEEKGMLTRQVDPDNKRKKLVFLTPKAREVIERMNSIYQDWDKSVCDGISLEEKSNLEKVVGIMAGNSIVMIKGDTRSCD